MGWEVLLGGMTAVSLRRFEKFVAGLLFTTIVGFPILCFAEVVYVPYPVEKTGRVQDEPHIRIFGEIKKEDDKKVQTIIDLYRGQMIRKSRMMPVTLDSHGGDVDTAMQIGAKLRNAYAWTMVDMNDECSSACVFILASGVRRDVFSGGKIGLHRPRFDQEYFAGLSRGESEFLYGSLLDGLRSYILAMGVSEKVIDDMVKTPSWKIDYRDREYAETVGLVGDDPSFHEWQRAQDVKEYGEKHMKMQDLWVECYNSGIVSYAICDRLYKNHELTE
ncbi:hypothetical protein ATG98_2188 [Marinobacter sp. LV10R520-4]|uniref:hypothetical protein n=1 Tax=Marinobacter sp. LV10R520-4 TaxID=1761796 RepID=UPI000BF8E070|nr:hypothetical protein [Marinobacter sp. LV10R520-4]PFG53106.1 hypothetical protein ATG98_2188 [Marinobacter sp. LV10R520-4]